MTREARAFGCKFKFRVPDNATAAYGVEEALKKSVARRFGSIVSWRDDGTRNGDASYEIRTTQGPTYVILYAR